ncbi:Tetratricopeptide repeat protein 17 [Trichinella pseudospiralis]|uniref:Tetratricopeptide repeat protein 17 n=1 Tax=Trichinella pseudospiralis TaxID=6337 RepID=A0A0V1IUI4_TRIPS|nr:Tetratricopeptide repeat protein 17 [Trichinella pseudospiralis]KRZ31890.1 Tetratricopeptide repeat protein 17 [Trichinella pseudospiralis]
MINWINFHFTFIILLHCCTAINQWIVSDGVIEPVKQSFFNILRPHDLVQFLNQETIFLQINAFNKELHKRANSINERQIVDDPDVDIKIISTDPDCATPMPFVQLVGTFPTSVVPLSGFGYQPDDIENLRKLSEGAVSKQPHCGDYLSLSFSVAVLDQIESVHNPSLITSKPEASIASLVFKEWPTTGHFGTSVARALERNPTSWELYTLASYYWRAVGNSTEAIHCLRSAVYFVPRNQIVIPMLSLLNVLGHGNRLADASIVADMTVAMNNSLGALITVSHVYAATSQYKKASTILKLLMLMPMSNVLRSVAENYVAAIKCHEKLENALQEQHTNLNSLLDELDSFKELLEDGQALLSNLDTVEDRESALNSEMLYNYITYSPVPGLECRLKSEASGKLAMKCDAVSHEYERHIQNAENRQIRKGKQLSPKMLQDDVTKEEDDDDEEYAGEESDDLPLYPSDVGVKFPSRWSLSGDKPNYSDANSQSSTSSEACWKIPENPPSLFIHSDSKGVKVKEFWKIYIKFRDGFAVESLVEQRPMCKPFMTNVNIVQLPSGDRLLKLYKLANVYENDEIARKVDPALSEHVQQMIGPLQNPEHELGQFLFTMIKYRMGPTWLMFNLAALYWRMLNMYGEAFACLCVALNDPDGVAYNDMALTQLSVLAHQIGGKLDDAIDLAEKAIQVDNSEPDSHHLLGYYLTLNQSYSSAVEHLTLSLELEPKSRREIVQLLRAARLLDQGVENLPCFVEKLNRWSETSNSCGQRNSFNEVIMKASSEELCERVRKHPIPLEEELDADDDYEPALSLADGSYVQPEVERGRKSMKKATFVDVAVQIPSEELENVRPPPPPHRHVARLQKDTRLPTVVPELPLHIYDARPVVVDHVQHSLSECQQRIRNFNFDSSVSMWLSPQSKGLDVGKLLHFETAVEEEAFLEPICPTDFAGNMWTMDHLAGFTRRDESAVDYKPEKGLAEVLLSLSSNRGESLQMVATRITHAMQNPSDDIWLCSLVASLYWRTVGNSSMAIDCLRHSIAYAPTPMKDLGWISLANVYQRSGWFRSALIVAGAALRLSPKLVIIHFILANIYASLGDWQRALAFYYSTVLLQENFEPAKERMHALLCARKYHTI